MEFRKDFTKIYFLETLKAGQIEFKTNDVDEYLENLSKFFDKISPLGFTVLGNKLTFKSLFTAELPAGFAIILIGNNWVRDICLYWNFHLGANIMRVNSRHVLLPYSFIKSSAQVRKFVNLLKRVNWCPRQVILFSDSVDMKKRLRLRDRLEKYLNGAKGVSVSGFRPIADFSVSNSTIGESTIVEDNKAVLRVPDVQFSGFVQGGDWAIDIKQRSPNEYPVSSKLNHFLCGSPSEQSVKFYGGYWVRYGGYQIISARVNKKTQFSSIYTVNEYSAFKAILSDKGYSVPNNDIHSYTEAFMKILGIPSILDKKGIRDLFW